MGVAVLLAASALYCWIADPGALPVLVMSIVGNFSFMLLLRSVRNPAARRGLTGVGIGLNVAVLAAFKWLQANAAPEVAVAALGGRGGVIPLGLTFYTLQQISYLVDAQKQGATRLSLPRYAAWMGSFAQLPAGPIATYRMMADQYAVLGRKSPSAATLARGATLFFAGVVKKTWLADPLGQRVDRIWDLIQSAAMTPWRAWTAAWGYFLQLYFDFSAYSDMAIGLALCVGIALPMNFNSPLKATSPGEYVMRWHVSLMMFVRSYVFEPMFQAARRLPIRPTPRRYLVAWSLATIAAFVTVGLWHTLSLSTLGVALAVGLLMVVLQNARLRWRSTPRSRGALWRWTSMTVSRLMLLAAAAICALFLRAETPAEAMKLLAVMLPLGNTSEASRAVTPFPIPFFIIGASIVALVAPNTMQIFGIGGATPAPAWLRWRSSARWGFAAGGLFILALIGIANLQSPRSFIYARF